MAEVTIGFCREKVGRTPGSARDPLVALFLASRFFDPVSLPLWMRRRRNDTPYLAHPASINLNSRAALGSRK
ncbi:hypothetical protein SBA4_1740012 [Candidatus Sulfopaludibacter sp. SbA4]|nr:hypothetical protein SBA4_1740012 [Candidatus Sulfopaludibacter sp. SbA4]